jgi:hypothetical protein
LPLSANEIEFHFHYTCRRVSAEILAVNRPNASGVEHSSDG